MIIPEQGEVSLYHWTNAFDPEEKTVVLDPVIARRKQNSYSRREYQTANTPRVFFYTQPHKRERWFRSGKELYTTKVPAESIYDLSVDKENIIEKTKQENSGVLDFSKLFENIIDADYKGAAYRTGHDIVVWFYPIEVKKSEVQEKMTDFYENWNAFMENLDAEEDSGGGAGASFEDLFPPYHTGDPSVQNYPMRLEETEFEDIFPPRVKAAPSTQNYPMRLGEGDGEMDGKEYNKTVKSAVRKLEDSGNFSLAAKIDVLSYSDYEDERKYAYQLAKKYMEMSPEKVKQADKEEEGRFDDPSYREPDDWDGQPYDDNYDMEEAASFKDIYPTKSVDPSIRHYHTRMEEDGEGRCECELKEGMLEKFIGLIKEMGAAEGEYLGKKVRLNRPMRTEEGHPKKYKVYMKEGNRVKKVTFGGKNDNK